MSGAEFSRTFLPLSEALYRVAFFILEDEAAAQDAVQDVLLKIWEKRGQMDAVKNPRSWSLQMMKNHCLDIVKSAASRGRGKMQESESGEDISRRSEAREQLAATLKAIERLPEKQKMVLKMYTIDELTYEEMAERTGMSGLNLRVLLSQARKNLKRMTII